MHTIKAHRLQPLVFLGFRFLFGKPLRNSSAPTAHRGKHGAFWGAVLGISVSIVPLYIVLFVSNGMIQGITDRYLETKTSHLQLSLPLGVSGETRKNFNRTS
jgi:ABC-type transport system, involved in lipoprotein release, permease component